MIIMGKRGRFGKYGETKRFKRLRESRSASLAPKGTTSFTPKSARAGLSRRKVHDQGQRRPITFRKAGPLDEAFITQLSRKVFSVFGPYDEMVPRWMMEESTVTIIACLDNRPVGFVMLGDPFNRYDLSQAVELLAIAVDPEEHRKGIGELLLREVDKKAIEHGVRRIFLHTAAMNHSARSLFTKAGYRPWEIKGGFYPEGQDAVVMSKEP